MPGRRSTARSTPRTTASLTKRMPRPRKPRPAPPRDWDRRFLPLGDPANPWNPLRGE